MKITGETTLAELARYLEATGNPFVTLMKAHPNSSNARHAIIYAAGQGTFHGGGATEAEALEDAFTSMRNVRASEARLSVKRAHVQILADGRCNCTAADLCPLGRTGSSTRCSRAELEVHYMTNKS